MSYSSLGLCSKPSILFSLHAVIGLAVMGCNASHDFAGTVKGKVTIDGQLAETGTISFVPVGQKYPIARGDIVNGQYMQEVPSGEYKVMISSHKVVSEENIYGTPDSPKRKITAEILPVRYNDQTELLIEVGEAETNYNFDLSSK